MSVEDTLGTIEAIKDRFPDAEIRNDICYATTNRQQAVKEMAERADLVIVVGCTNSSNPVRLVEVAYSMGVRAQLVDRLNDIDPAWYADAETVGLTAGASVPDELLDLSLIHLSEPQRPY